MLRKSLVLFTALFLLAASTACSKKPLTGAALQGESTLSMLRALSDAYEPKNTAAFMSRIDERFKDRDSLEKELERIFKSYQAISFSVQPLKMLVVVEQRGPIRTTFNWHGEWQTAGGRTVKDGGRVTFELDPATNRLIAIDGRNPFLLQKSAVK